VVRNDFLDANQLIGIGSRDIIPSNRGVIIALSGM